MNWNSYFLHFFSQARADRNVRKVTARVEARKKIMEEAEARARSQGLLLPRPMQPPMLTKKECLKELRKCVAKVDIRDVRQSTLDEIAKVSLRHTLNDTTGLLVHYIHIF